MGQTSKTHNGEQTLPLAAAIYVLYSRGGAKLLQGKQALILAAHIVHPQCGMRLLRVLIELRFLELLMPAFNALFPPATLDSNARRKWIEEHTEDLPLIEEASAILWPLVYDTLCSLYSLLMVWPNLQRLIKPSPVKELIQRMRGEFGYSRRPWIWAKDMKIENRELCGVVRRYRAGMLKAVDVFVEAFYQGSSLKALARRFYPKKKQQAGLMAIRQDHKTMFRLVFGLALPARISLQTMSQLMFVSDDRQDQSQGSRPSHDLSRCPRCRSAARITELKNPSPHRNGDMSVSIFSGSYFEGLCPEGKEALGADHDQRELTVGRNIDYDHTVTMEEAPMMMANPATRTVPKAGRKAYNGGHENKK